MSASVSAEPPLFGGAPGQEGPHDLHGKVLIGKARHALQIGLGEAGPAFGQIESAVTGEAGQQNLIEREAGGRAPGGDVAHVRGLFLAAARATIMTAPAGDKLPGPGRPGPACQRSSR